MGSTQTDPDSIIPELRHFSRQLVREWGYMSPTAAGTSYPASAVHALLEISASQNTGKGINAASLCAPLNLDKSSVSRVVKKLVEAGEVEEEFDGGAAGRGDGRVKRLALSEKGQKTVEGVDEFGTHQVAAALSKLPPTASPTIVLEGIKAYATALRSQRLDPSPFPTTQVQPQPQTQTPPALTQAIQKQSEKEAEIIIATGYRPTLLAHALELHMVFYGPYSNFGLVFESVTATGMGELVMRLDGVKSQVWCAVQDEKLVGCVWIDGEDLNRKNVEARKEKDEKKDEMGVDPDRKVLEDAVGDRDTDKGGNAGKKARLRFFIVGDGVRGKGVGKQLLNAALAFCDEMGFEECQLFTYKGLDAARKLYERCGFVLVSEVVGSPWGVEILLQQFVRMRAGGVV